MLLTPLVCGSTPQAHWFLPGSYGKCTAFENGKIHLKQDCAVLLESHHSKEMKDSL